MISQANQLRAALADLSQGGVLSFYLQAVKARPEFSRTALGWLKRTKEVTTRADGKLEYHPKSGPEAQVRRIYRAVRAYKGPFTVHDIATVAEVSGFAAGRALKALIFKGYLRRLGGRGRERIYALTSLGRETPNPPPVIYRPIDFAEEKQAAARLAEIFLTADLSTDAAAQAILKQLEIIGRRFGGPEERDDDRIIEQEN